MSETKEDYHSRDRFCFSRTYGFGNGFDTASHKDVIV